MRRIIPRYTWPLLVGLGLTGGVQKPAPRLLEILYTGDGTLCSVSTAGDRKVCAKSNEEFDDPSWDPRGTRVVVEAGQHDGASSLVLLDSTGKRLRRLVSSSGAIRPAWSPDGRYVFAIDYGIGSAVARWNADGTARMRIPVTGGSSVGQQVRSGAPPAQFQMLSFSPSGRRVALLTMRFREMLVATVGDTAMTVFRTAPRDFAYVSQSVWLDESHLLFVGKRAPGRGELWELNVEDGTARRRGIDGLALRDQIALSPDRKSVAVTALSDSVRGWNVWTITLADGHKRHLTNGNEDIVGSWR